MMKGSKKRAKEDKLKKHLKDGLRSIPMAALTNDCPSGGLKQHIFNPSELWRPEI